MGRMFQRGLRLWLEVVLKGKSKVVGFALAWGSSVVSAA